MAVGASLPLDREPRNPRLAIELSQYVLGVGVFRCTLSATAIVVRFADGLLHRTKLHVHDFLHFVYVSQLPRYLLSNREGYE